ncbi:DivIVA domain-containing protein [Caproiciproducens faecalis]|uniref:DivIVA domain-containing protein n=1 Tax=Caproiciproducens faecalis TaxID=2820301 RepID=A0ABS7DQT4_9FIRM|nr:DivIVA domain-containing protein [Caproiciproducens faecalis]MBW7573654.1 DivIVA domain-containing protein [Caproiciproducens faecalis]
MLSMNDIINASFRKSGFSGYRTEDVDQFIDQVKESYDTLLKKDLDQKESYERLKAENEQLLEKIKILAEKVEEYRKEEDEIKTALVSAQKLGDASIRESRHKAEIIVKDANIKAERIISGAKQSVVEQEKEMERLQQTVSDFRSKLLNLYKEHLTLIDALPSHKPEVKPAPAQNQDVLVPEPAAPSTVPEEVAQPAQEQISAGQPDSVFSAEVSNFDENEIPPEGKPQHFSSIQFSDDDETAGDGDSTDGVYSHHS